MRRFTLLSLLLVLTTSAAQAQAPEAPAPNPPRDAPSDEGTTPAPAPEPHPEPAADAPPTADGPAAEAPADSPGDEESAPVDWSALSEELAEEEDLPSEDESPEATPEGSANEENTSEEDDWVLDAYEVRAPVDPFRTGGSVQLLSEETLDAYDYDDINSALQQLPGVYIRQEEGFGLRPNIGLRGTTSDRSSKVTLMEDGVLFGPAPYSAPAAYYFPVFSRIIGVDVYKGPAAVLFGPNTIGGAINLRTREVPTTPEGRFELSYGRFQYRRAHFYYGASSRHAGVLFEGVHLGTNGFRDVDAGDPDTGFQRSEFMLRGFAQTTPGERVFNRIDLKLGFSRERSNETYLGLADADFRESPYRRYAASQLDRMTWWRTQVELRHHLVVGEHVDVVTTAYRHDVQRTWRRLNRFVGERDGSGPSLFDVLNDPTAARQNSYFRVLSGERDSTEFGPDHDLLVVSNARRFVSQGVQSELHATFGERVQQELIVGLRLHYDEVDRNHVERAYSLIAGQLVDNGDEPSTITLNLGSTIAVAGHAAYSLSYRGLTVKPGIRLESIRATLSDELAAGGPRSSTQHYVVVLPGLGSTYEFTEHVAAVAGVHRGFSPLAPGAGDNVEVETSIAYEAGVRVQYEEQHLSAEVIGFVNDYQQFVTQCGGSGGCDATDLDRQFNAGDVLIGGVELQAAYELSLGRGLQLPVHFSYTFTRATFRTAFSESSDPQLGDVAVGDPVPYVPEHQWSLQLGLTHASWAVNASATYVSAMPEIANNTVRTEGYAVVDVTGKYTVLERFDITLRLENLTNAQPLVSRRPFGARGYRPFMVQVGIEVPL